MLAVLSYGTPMLALLRTYTITCVIIYTLLADPINGATNASTSPLLGKIRHLYLVCPYTLGFLARQARGTTDSSGNKVRG